MFSREDFVYVGVDVHSKSHSGVMVDHYGDQIGKAMKFEAAVPAYPAWVEQVEKRAHGKGIVFGLEDVHGLGRSLARYLLDRGYKVKFANAYLTKRERPSINKHDALDALSVARITAKYLHSLPDADIDPLQWALLSTVTHRRGLVNDQNRLKNKLSNLLHQAWPEFRSFFSEPFDGKAALAFWEKYPSVYRLAGVTLEELTEFLRKASHYYMGQQKAEKIMAVVGQTEEPDWQFERDAIIRSAVKQLRHVQEQIVDAERHLARLIARTDYHLTDIPGMDVASAAELIALVGDVGRFKTVDKFLAYTGIAPGMAASGESEVKFRSKFGRRQLHAFFHNFAAHQLVLAPGSGKPRNSEAVAYYNKVLGDQAVLPKDKQDKRLRRKALLSLMRQQAKRLYKLMKAQKAEAMAKKAAEAIPQVTEGDEAA